MPMGIKNVPATFQSLMDLVLKSMHGIKILVYLDDLDIYSETLEEHDTKARRRTSAIFIDSSSSLRPHNRSQRSLI